MIPPLIRRCPNCGYVGLATQFAAAGGDDRGRVECPSCHERFEPFGSSLLN